MIFLPMFLFHFHSASVPGSFVQGGPKFVTSIRIDSFFTHSSDQLITFIHIRLCLVFRILEALKNGMSYFLHLDDGGIKQKPYVHDVGSGDQFTSLRKG